jgi:hypothetical protein
MTGACISTNNPIAFFAVNTQARIPNILTYIASPLFQQLSPINTWDKTFFVPVALEKNIVRIVASQSNTDITQLVGGTLRTGVSGA